MMILEHKINFSRQQSITLPGCPISAAAVDDQIYVYTYDSPGYFYSSLTEDYIFICLPANEPFDRALLEGSQFLGSVVVKPPVEFITSSQVIHVFYKRDLSKLFQVEPLSNLGAHTASINYLDIPDLKSEAASGVPC